MKVFRNRPARWDLLLSAAQFSAAAYAVWRARHRPAMPRAVLAPGAPRPVPDRVIGTASAAQPGATGTPHSGSRLAALGRVALAAARSWSEHRAASKGAALALYTLFSLAPMLVLVVAMAGFFYGEENVRRLLLEQMQGLIGPQGAEAIKAILAPQPKSTSLTAGIISAVLVLISATSAFAELKDSLDELWEIPKKGSSGIWGLLRERFLSFGLLLVLTLMLLMSLAISTALAAFGSLWGGGAESVIHVVSQFLSSAVSFVIVATIFAVIFKYLPATRIAWKDVLIGALATAVLFITGKAAIGLYLSHGSIGSSYGAAGSLVVLITWIYYSSQIFFYGSLFTHEYAIRLGSRAHAAGTGQVSGSAPPRTDTDERHGTAYGISGK